MNGDTERDVFVRLISFVIPVRDDAESLRRCLDSIRNSEWPHDGVEIIVMDNGSRDDALAVAEEFGARHVWLAGVRVGELRNRGALLATGSLVAFVDADHEIDKHWIRGAIEVLSEHPRAGAVGAP